MLKPRVAAEKGNWEVKRSFASNRLGLNFENPFPPKRAPDSTIFLAHELIVRAVLFWNRESEAKLVGSSEVKGNDAAIESRAAVVEEELWYLVEEEVELHDVDNEGKDPMDNFAADEELHERDPSSGAVGRVGGIRTMSGSSCAGVLTLTKCCRQASTKYARNSSFTACG